MLTWQCHIKKVTGTAKWLQFMSVRCHALCYYHITLLWLRWLLLATTKSSDLLQEVHKRNRCLKHLSDVDVKNLKTSCTKVELGLVCLCGCWCLVKQQRTISMMDAGSAQNHTRGLSSVPCQHAAQDICQQKRHIPYPHHRHILPFMSRRKTWGYFWGYSGIQDGWSLTDYSLEEDGKQRTWYGSCWLGCHGEKCLNKQYESPASMLCEHCHYLPLCFLLCCYLTLFVVFIYVLKIFPYCVAC